MRDADDGIKPFYQEDISSLKDELEKQQAVLSRIEALKSESRNLCTKKRFAYLSENRFFMKICILYDKL